MNLTLTLLMATLLTFQLHYQEMKFFKIALQVQTHFKFQAMGWMNINYRILTLHKYQNTSLKPVNVPPSLSHQISTNVNQFKCSKSLFHQNINIWTGKCFTNSSYHQNINRFESEYQNTLLEPVNVPPSLSHHNINRCEPENVPSNLSRQNINWCEPVNVPPILRLTKYEQMWTSECSTKVCLTKIWTDVNQ
jgi:hypothetical protein